MYFSTTTSLLFLLASSIPALAQAPANSSTTPAAAGSSNSVPVWVVHVGSPNDDQVFTPNSIQAKPGDMVQFQFYSKVRPLP